MKDIPQPSTGLPVILVTGYPSMGTALDALGNSVMAYLLKPLDFNELLRHVRRAVGLRRVQTIAQESSLRFQRWADEWKAFEAEVKASPPAFGATSIQGLMGMVLGNLASSTLDLKQLYEIGQQAGEAQGPCQLQVCPRLDAFKEAIHEGVAVLERTKGSFKSKEIGDLRKKFNSLLEAQ